MTGLKLTGFAAAALLGSALLAGQASAMPANGLAAAAPVTSNVQDVRWVCGPYRCWWAPGPYWGYGPRWRRGWGWRHRRW